MDKGNGYVQLLGMFSGRLVCLGNSVLSRMARMTFAMGLAEDEPGKGPNVKLSNSHLIYR